ncbi:hypothetical protein G6F46_000139 [Rhizopus delemar]|uniref:Tc1-like transposase DDE domain-containing protein n=3 Tax=Rhizopus TaxID=4842 RepID=I1BJN1_RHIO9|nr:hypothetical protein RO3G_01115 [Rhizopus delemar RA 99-880]KAG1466482.1 hypothetical protein G6F55_000457 [Rhizopus delemar]KAG1554056.1 hypothetical protein G6F51_000203 [Rhizopus arrhizus]KAG1501490.1 hypothetical protein G6F54_003006 [Rhizopus delemar]KAG1515051.1 hypothetical protein G6F53_003213 [Rhizopus delemar]|eukprot:EIE76411.1 hypothetical protein RO3G_01115 [Rhizopus delemar RA 99-880]
MKEECNLSIKVISRNPLARNDDKNLEARADWVDKWITKGISYLDNCVFLDESGFDGNKRRSCGWSPRGTKAITTTPSIKVDNLVTVTALMVTR